MKKEDWINKVMVSIDQLDRVAPPADLFSKIEARIMEKPIKLVPLHWVIGVAASFLVLVFMNISALKENGTNSLSISTADAFESVKSELDPSNYLY
ncbi:MAG: hypothetical protein JKY48_11555 [Flavobacteriales bacterium]|nr:hypothetical protein [Flavobacteriales bacterium]